MRDMIRRKHLAVATERAYCGWLVRYAAFVADRCEAELKP